MLAAVAAGCGDSHLSIALLVDGGTYEFEPLGAIAK